MRLSVLIGVCLWLVTSRLTAEDDAYSHSRNLPPLKLAASDLDAILLKTQSLVAAANGPPSPQDSARENVKLDVDGKEIEIPHFSLASSVAFPRELFRFSYNYYRPDKPISSVILDLGDYSRCIAVSGESSNQVDVITQSLANDLLHYSMLVGGATFRNVIGVCLAVVLVTAVVASTVYWWNTRSSSGIGMLICSVAGLVLLLFVPWRRYLPGFALYQSYSPFVLIRYAPQIYFVSLLASLAGIPLSYFLPRLRCKT
jgi:hypothetical protein